MGSSPRVRGKHDLITTQKLLGHLIPARAGKTRSGPPPGSGRTAHPRVCGENVGDRARLCGVLGSSPRVRGKQGHSGNERSDPGLIPACAGKTPRAPCPGYPDRAHPRACGENVVCSAMSFGFPGSSPRVRGKPHRQRQPPDEAGLIPARAGKTGGSVCRSASQAAHPRACGENVVCSAMSFGFPGSSPRVRGKPHRQRQPPDEAGLIPARAGKTGGSVCRSASQAAHPRACGENGGGFGLGGPFLGSSPRVRGKPSGRSPGWRPPRLIPARAGKTLAAELSTTPGAAHPRACGENRR